jgi:hypothetical protein
VQNPQASGESVANRAQVPVARTDVLGTNIPLQVPSRKCAGIPPRDILHGCIGPGQFFIATDTFKMCHYSYESVSYTTR